MNVVSLKGSEMSKRLTWRQVNTPVNPFTAKDKSD